MKSLNVSLMGYIFNSKYDPYVEKFENLISRMKTLISKYKSGIHSIPDFKFVWVSINQIGVAIQNDKPQDVVVFTALNDELICNLELIYSVNLTDWNKFMGKLLNQ